MWYNILGVVKRNPLFLHEIEWKNNGFLFTTPNIYNIHVYMIHIYKYIIYYRDESKSHFSIFSKVWKFWIIID